MPTEHIQSYRHTCTRCIDTWISQNSKPKRCAKCNSPYWDRERTAIRYAPLMPKEEGNTVVIPWPNGPYNGHATVDKIAKRLGHRVEYKIDGAHVTYGPKG